MQTKTCTRCKETKPVSEFHKDRGKKDGLCSYCKVCNLERVRLWAEDNPEKYRESNRRRRESNKAQTIRWRKRSKEEINARSLELAHRQGLPWEDWEEEFVMADNGLTTYQKAVKLGRGYHAIESRRYILKKSARAELAHND